MSNPFAERAAALMREEDSRQEREALRQQEQAEWDAFAAEVIRQESHRLWLNAHGQDIPPMSPAQYLYNPLV